MPRHMMSDDTMRAIQKNGFECYPTAGPCDPADPMRLYKQVGIDLEPNKHHVLPDGQILWRDGAGTVFLMPPMDLKTRLLMNVARTLKLILTTLMFIRRVRQHIAMRQMMEAMTNDDDDEDDEDKMDEQQARQLIYALSQAFSQGRE